MDTQDIVEIIMNKLEKLEAKMENKHEALIDKIDAKHEKMSDKIEEVKENQSQQMSVLKDLPEMKKDLYEHKEGVIQNRGRIAVLERALTDKTTEIVDSIEEVKKRVDPIADHVEFMQALPDRFINGLIWISKALAAIVAIGGSIGAIVAKFMGWF